MSGVKLGKRSSIEDFSVVYYKAEHLLTMWFLSPFLLFMLDAHRGC